MRVSLRAGMRTIACVGLDLGFGARKAEATILVAKVRWQDGG